MQLCSYLLSVACLPLWSGMCSDISVTEGTYANINGLYTLITNSSANGRPMYERLEGKNPRYIVYNNKRWVRKYTIGSSVPDNCTKCQMSF